MDDKENEDEYVFMVQMVVIKGTSMQQMTDIPVKVELDEKHLVIDGNARFAILNPKTLMGTMTHQGA
jgi:hypothetical protein